MATNLSISGKLTVGGGGKFDLFNGIYGTSNR